MKDNCLSSLAGAACSCLQSKSGGEAGDKSDAHINVAFPAGAAESAERARCLDLKDRYLNSLAVKALLGAGHIEAADRTAALFTKDAGEQATSLFDMQHMWCALHALCCARSGS